MEVYLVKYYPDCSHNSLLLYSGLRQTRLEINITLIKEYNNNFSMKITIFTPFLSFYANIYSLDYQC